MAPNIDPAEARQFAVEVVQRLRGAGHEALWAGGCVRDQLLGQEPKDYDVATNATPDEIRRVFGERRTRAIGAAFGVISVLGKRRAGQIEVATFRRDAQYSDGRHPDHVTFSTAAEDAQRRDFTINGLFYDPLAEQVIDYVGGQADLKQQVVRAIGDPAARFAEDKLRMLRAIRFAATFGFTIDPITLAAIQRLAAELVIVSAERIAAEMRRMLVHAQRRRAVQLLRESALLNIVLPEASVFEAPGVGDERSGDSRWQRTLQMLERLEHPSFPAALAVLIRETRPEAADPATAAEAICRRWRLANSETAIVSCLLQHETTIRAARQSPWPQLQRLLVSPHAVDLLCYCAAVVRANREDEADVDYCREKLRLPLDELDPPPLISGNDLIARGWRPGPQFRAVLEAIRDAQLEQRIRSAAEALDFAQRWRASPDDQA